MTPPKIITDLFTGPDGATWAIGRVYSLPVLASGISLPFVAIFHGQTVDLAAAGALFAGLGGAVMVLVLGTNHTEPKPDGDVPK
ncbi:MAG: hypothetical protein JWP35_4680 [Caulobacter sp.]|nr:hypothetical protein [Caulobacter sp.]